MNELDFMIASMEESPIHKAFTQLKWIDVTENNLKIVLWDCDYFFTKKLGVWEYDWYWIDMTWLEAITPVIQIP